VETQNQNQNTGSSGSAALGKFAGGGAYAAPTVFDPDTERLTPTHQATLERILSEQQQKSD
jgi:hypothetical protein